MTIRVFIFPAKVGYKSERKKEKERKKERKREREDLTHAS
jgi:hypothetical protein